MIDRNVNETANDIDHLMLPAGLSARPATLEDAAHVAALYNETAQALIGADDTRPADLLRTWEHPLMVLEACTLLVCDAQNTPVAYAEVFSAEAPYVRPQVRLRVHPTYAETGLQAVLLGWVEDCAHDLLLPDAPPEARFAVEAVLYGSDERSARRWRAAGWALVRHFLRMSITFEEPPAPAPQPQGITIRQMRPEEERAAIYADWEAFQDHWGMVHTDFAEGYAAAKHWIETEPAYDPSLVTVAVEGDEVVGLALALPSADDDPGAGYVASLAVRRAWRRRGIGAALLRHAFTRLYAYGKRAATLDVDANSLTGALDLYRKAGMHPIRRMDVYERELRAGVDLTTHALAEA